jgi:hypothetical protein
MTATTWKVGSQNAVTTSLNGAITDSDTTVALTSSTGLQYPGIIVVDRIDANNTSTPSQREYISFTGISGDSLTGCTRGVGNSTAQAHSSGAIVEEVWTVTHWGDFYDAWTAEHSEAGAHTKGVETVTYSADTNLDLSLGNIFQVTMTGNITNLTVSNATVGQIFVLRLIQDGTGSRTVTNWFSTIKWEDGVEPTLTTTADKTDVFVFMIVSSGNYDGFTVGQNLS